MNGRAKLGEFEVKKFCECIFSQDDCKHFLINSKTRFRYSSRISKRNTLRRKPRGIPILTSLKRNRRNGESENCREIRDACISASHRIRSPLKRVPVNLFRIGRPRYRPKIRDPKDPRAGQTSPNIPQQPPIETRAAIKRIKIVKAR